MDAAASHSLSNHVRTCLYASLAAIYEKCISAGAEKLCFTVLTQFVATHVIKLTLPHVRNFEWKWPALITIIVSI